ncbi:MAG TPA: hypothetical protein VJ724_12710, partial [Tahibacter sp.]|nr:hypothetical protein [Tahibacter sp.]
KRSPKADARFFRALETAASIALACRRAGYSRAAVYRWRAHNADFAKRWRLAIAMAADALEAEADRRGRDGVPVDEVLKRNERGTRRYSDTLLLARLKAVRPELYREPSPPVARRPAHAPPPRVYDSGAFTVIDYAQPTPDAARYRTSGTRKWHS